MKHLFIFSFLLITTGLFAQSTAMLDTNNVNAMLSDNGIFFGDEANSQAAYEIPAGSGNHTAYTMAFWITAKDGAGQLYTSCTTFAGGQDVFAGPIANDYSSTYYSTEFLTSLWPITKAEINYHSNNYTATGYVASAAILNWPGNGDVSEGVAEQLAPYIDVNGDNVYNPYDGDYPYIQGDKAVYVIMNDLKDVHANTGGNALGVEIHAMFYQFATNDEINNTTFMNVKIYNRSTVAYTDFRFGLFLDYDLGFYQDDFVGSDSTRNLTYVYNGDEFDEGGTGQPGYGVGPPAFGTIMLNEPMGTSLFFTNGIGGFSDPTSAVDYYEYMNATPGGLQLTNDLGAPTNFSLTGNPYLGTGWNEVSAGNASGDRRMIMSTESTSLSAGNSNCYDYAFIYNHDDTTSLGNVNALLSTSDFVQNYYDNNLQACGNIFVGTEEIDQKNLTFYPNPTSGIINIDMNESYRIEVYDLNGKVVYTDFKNDGASSINLDLQNGMYIIKVYTESTIYVEKVQVQK